MVQVLSLPDKRNRHYLIIKCSFRLCCASRAVVSAGEGLGDEKRLFLLSQSLSLRENKSYFKSLLVSRELPKTKQEFRKGVKWGSSPPALTIEVSSRGRFPNPCVCLPEETMRV